MGTGISKIWQHSFRKLVKTQNLKWEWTQCVNLKHIFMQTIVVWLVGRRQTGKWLWHFRRATVTLSVWGEPRRAAWMKSIRFLRAGSSLARRFSRLKPPNYRSPDDKCPSAYDHQNDERSDPLVLHNTQSGREVHTYKYIQTSNRTTSSDTHRLCFTCRKQTWRINSKNMHTCTTVFD